MDEDPRRVIPNEVFTRKGVFIIGATSITVRSRSIGRPLRNSILVPGTKERQGPDGFTCNGIDRVSGDAMTFPLTTIEPPR